MRAIPEKEWIEDFQEFVRSEGVPVPESISSAVLAQIRSDLNPSPWLVFVKLLGIHSMVGTVSLAICSQFGINPFHTGFSLSDYFMKFGHSTCMFLCGILFLGLTTSIGRFVFQPEEISIIRRNSSLQIFGLSMISLGVFAIAGAEITLFVGVLWLLGAMLGGMIAVRLPKMAAQTT